MPVFKYKAKNADNKIDQGTIVAVSKSEAGALLRKDNLTPLFVKEIITSQKFRIFTLKRLPLIEKANLCRYLATMIKAGLPLNEAVEVLYNEASHPVLRKILNDIQIDLQKGQLLSKTFSSYPQDFDEVFLTLVKAGEEGGNLDKSFEYLGKQLYSEYELEQKIKSTLAYPAVVTLATLGLGVGMLIFVVPKIAPVLLRLSKDFPLPAHTIIILKLGLFVSENLLFFGIGLVAFLILFGLFLVSSKGRKIASNVMAKLPVVGGFYNHLALARFSRTLATLLGSGVPITKTLQVSVGTLNLPRYRKLSGFLSDEIAKGKSLSVILKTSDLFPPIMTGMIATGEKTATLDLLLVDLGLFYEEKVSNSLKAMTDLIEPVLMLGIGLAVGVAVISLIAPIYSFVGSLSQSIGGG